MSDPAYMLDASALLALLLGEDGTDIVHDILSHSRISAVNISEIVAKLQERGVPDSLITTSLADLDLGIVPFDRDDAIRAGLLRASTRNAGLSFGDRACLAAAIATGTIAVTADRAWAQLDLDVQVMTIR